jgi:hypothetical protein
MTILYRKIIVAKTKEVKTMWSSNLAESSKEGYGSKRAVLPMKMMMMVVMSSEKTRKTQMRPVLQEQ